MNGELSGEEGVQYEQDDGRHRIVGEPGQRVNIDQRTFDYGLRIVRLFQYLCHRNERVGWILGRQLVRSGTSIGANIAEAQSGESRADFVHKMSIAQKEARESLYWLRLMVAAELVPNQRAAPIVDETEQIVAIITSIIVSAKRRQ